MKERCARSHVLSTLQGVMWPTLDALPSSPQMENTTSSTVSRSGSPVVTFRITSRQPVTMVASASGDLCSPQSVASAYWWQGYRRDLALADRTWTWSNHKGHQDEVTYGKTGGRLLVLLPGPSSHGVFVATRLLRELLTSSLTMPKYLPRTSWASSTWYD